MEIFFLRMNSDLLFIDNLFDKRRVNTTIHSVVKNIFICIKSKKVYVYVADKKK